MTFGEFIKEFRTHHHLSQRQFAEKAGVSNGYISMLEKNENPQTKSPLTPSMPVLKKIANAMGMSVNDMCSHIDDMAIDLGASTTDFAAIPNIIPIPPMHQIPLVGTIACGTPITAEENVEGYVSVEGDLNCQFALRCKGDSMSPRVISGDLVYIRMQPDVNDGQIAAVLIDGEATLKHVYHIQDGVQLVSDNPAYKPLIYTGEACANLRIIGLAVAYQRML